MEHLGTSPDKGRTPHGEAGLAGLDPILRACGEIAAVRLADGLSEALGLAIRQLDLLCLQSAHHEDCAEIADAAAFARARRHNLVNAFGPELERRYVRACVRRPSPLSGYLVDFDVKQLRIVQHDRLDDSLAPGRLAEAIRTACWEPLCQLAIGFARQLGQSSMSPLDIPLSPNVIEVALAEALRGQPWRHESKDLLLRALCAGLPRSVHQLYLDLLPVLGQAVPARAAAAPEAPDLAGIAVADIPSESPAPDRASPAVTPMPPPAAAEPLPMSAVPPEPPPQAEAPPAPAAEPLPPPPGPPETRPPGEAPWQPLFARLGRLQDRARHSAHLVAELLRRPVELPVTAHPTLPGPLPLDPLPAAPPPVDAQPGRAPDASPQPPPAGLGDLKVGAWLDLREPDGTHRELKLAWVSPRRNLFLLTNREGARALSLGAGELEGLLRDGRVTLVPAPGEPGTASDDARTAEAQRRA